MHAKFILALTAAAFALPLGAQQAPAPTPLPSRETPRARQPFLITRDSVLVRRDTTWERSDSVRARSMSANEAELMRVINELREREAKLLRELMMTPDAETAVRRKLVDELQLVSREAFTVMSVIESRCMDERTATSSGYLGINITTEMEMRDRSTFVGRSMVTSVEPGSPAEAAGLLAGDRLLAVGGRDSRESLPALADLLVPGRRVVVKVEREGAARDIAVVVGVKPQYYKVASCPSFERALQPLRMGAVGRVWMTDTTDADGNRIVFLSPAPVLPRTPQPARPATPTAAPSPATAPTPPVAGATPTPPAPPTPAVAPTPPMAWGAVATGGSAVSYFGGAQFRALDDDWRAVLGLKDGTQGVFVNEVAPGSAAAQAGLRVGDVVTHVNDAAATSPFVVSRLIGVSEGSRATLKILRAREARTVTLRWDPR